MVSLTNAGTTSLLYRMTKTKVLTMSNAVMHAGGSWKQAMVVSMAAPCSTKRANIGTKMTEDMTVHSHTGINLKMHFTSST